MRKKELLKQIQEQAERISHLEQCLKTQDDLIDEYQNRERMSYKAIENAQKKAEEILGEANNRSQAILGTAENKKYHMISDAEETVRSYREMLDRYNSLLEQSARQAREGAEMFSSFVRSRIITEKTLDDGFDNQGALGSYFVEKLPDPEGDPAKLMHNIYKLQNRDIPAFSENKDEEVAPDDEERDPETIMAGILFDKKEQEPVEEKTETVSEVLKNSGIDNSEMDGDQPLDDLLEEIIKAGEKTNG